jgi:hypothetical protein
MRAWSCCLSLAALLIGCGDRTGLLVPSEPVGSAAVPEASTGAEEAGPPQSDAEVFADALPPIDVTVPHDAFNDCPNSESTFIYVVTQQFELLSFYPPTTQFRSIGNLNCPTHGMSASPFSMAVDRTGVAYVLFGEDPAADGAFTNGELFRVSTATAACQATGFASGQGGFSATFGMGYSGNNDGTETLYVASANDTDSTTPPPSLLATIDPTTFALKVVGNLPASVQRAELTGTGAGDLFGFYQSGSPSVVDSIGQIDKTSAKITNQSTLAGVTQGHGWAFAFWGGDFYTFTAPQDGTVVTRFRPTDKTIVTVAQRSDVVVGAGVSTCAPAK